jgi:hypothetical protein
MNASAVSRERWLLILAEATAIVVSILLAFAIDAWWQERAERKQEAALLVGLHADFRASQDHLERWLVGTRKILDATTALLDQVSRAEIGDEVTVPLELIVGAIGAPTYSPVDSTLEAAISSGQIDLIEDSEIRNVLATWRQQLADTTEDELLIREIVVHHLVPELSEEVRLAAAFDFNTLVDWFLDQSDLDLTEPVRFRATSGLEAAIAERVFYSTFVVGGLAEIYETQAEVLRLLSERMAKH